MTTTTDPSKMTPALLAVITERERQVLTEGWDAAHDDAHGAGSMAFAAAAYAVHAHAGPRLSGVLWNWTGWSRDWWKPKGTRRDLVRAAALLLAEIERLDRAEGRTFSGAHAVAANPLNSSTWTHDCPKSTGSLLLPVWSNCRNCGARAPEVLAPDGGHP